MLLGKSSMLLKMVGHGRSSLHCVYNITSPHFHFSRIQYNFLRSLSSTSNILKDKDIFDVLNAIKNESSHSWKLHMDNTLQHQETINLMVCRCARSHPLKLFELLDYLKSHGKYPDHDAYSLAIRTCPDLDVACQMFHRIVQHVPPTTLHESIIKHFVRQGDEVNAQSCLFQLKTFLLSKPHDSSSYDGLLRCICLCGESTDLQQVYDFFKSSAIQLAPSTLAELVLSYCHFQLVHQAYDVFQDIKQFDSFFQGKKYFIKKLLHGLLSLEEYDKVLETVATVIQLAIHPKILNELILFNRLLYAYSQAQNPIAGLRFFELMEPYVKPDAITFTSTMKLCNETGNYQTTVDLFGQMIDRNITPSSITFNYLVKAYGCLNQMDNIMQCLSLMDLYGVEPDRLSFNYMIYHLANASKWDDTKQLLQTMKRRLIDADVITYTTLIQAFIKDGKMNDAMEVLESMQDCGVLPNIVTYNSIMQEYLKSKKWGKVISTFQTCIDLNLRPDEQTFSYLVKAYTQDAIPSMKILNIIQEKHGIVPTVDIINVLLQHQVSQIDNKILRKELVNTLNHWNIQPNVATFNILVNGTSRMNSLQRAKVLLQLMTQYDVMPDTITFNSLLNVQQGDINDLSKIIDLMVEYDVKPNTTTFNTLIGVCTSKGVFKMALDTYHQMQSEGVVPDLVTYNSVIRLYTKMLKPEEGLNVFEEMMNIGVRPNSITLNTLIHGFASNQQLNEAENLLSKMSEYNIVPDALSFNPILHELARQGKYRRALDLLKTMQQANVKPTCSTLRSVIHAYGVAQRWDDAQAAMDRLYKENRIAVNAAVHLTLIKDLAKSKQWKRMYKNIDRMMVQVPVKDMNLNSILNLLIEKREWKQVYNILELLLKNGTPPSSLLFKKMVQACGSTYQRKAAENLVSSMNKYGLEINQQLLNDHCQVKRRMKKNMVLEKQI